MSGTLPSLPAIAPDERFLRLPAVLDLIGIGKSAWYDYVREGNAPKPVKIGTVNVWLESECRAWMADRVAASRDVGN